MTGPHDGEVTAGFGIVGPSAVLEDVHLIASRYGWPEAAILDLPGWRRARYAALIGAGARKAVGVAARSP